MNHLNRVFSLIAALIITSTGYGQQTFLHEDFSQFYRRGLAGEKDVYVLEPNMGNRKTEHSPVELCSDRHDPVSDEFNDAGICDSTETDHGFYAEIKVYDKGGDAFNDVLVFRLDTVLPKGGSGKLSMDVLFHKNAEYRIDSIQALLLESDKDIRSWIYSGAFAGQYILLSLRNVDNVSWKTLTASFTAEHDYRFLLIGNLKWDEYCKITKINNCKCGPKPKHEYWSYSSLLLDNVLLTADGRSQSP